MHNIVLPQICPGSLCAAACELLCVFCAFQKPLSLTGQVRLWVILIVQLKKIVELKRFPNWLKCFLCCGQKAPSHLQYYCMKVFSFAVVCSSRLKTLEVFEVSQLNKESVHFAHYLTRSLLPVYTLWNE